MKYVKRQPCSTCPFRVNSLQGYLGPESIESITRSTHGEFGWACHESIAGKPSDSKGLVDTNRYGQACIGAVLSATKSCKSYRPGPLSDLQQKLRRDKKQPDVLDTWQFSKYHSQKLGVSRE